MTVSFHAIVTNRMKNAGVVFLTKFWIFSSKILPSNKIKYY